MMLVYTFAYGKKFRMSLDEFIIRLDAMFCVLNFLIGCSIFALEMLPQPIVASLSSRLNGVTRKRFISRILPISGGFRDCPVVLI
jgi:hypothetical protein